MEQIGTFYGVGLGPGDPELLTLKARRVLSQVPVIFVPKAKITDEGLALQILLQALASQSKGEIRELVFPMSKDPLVLKPAWEEARRQVTAVLSSGRDCALITLGDTAIYSTYMNLLAGLRQELPELRIETVAGVSSFSQGAALLNLSLCEKNEKLAILPCLGEVEAMRPDLERFDAVVLMKVGKRFGALRDLLKGMGLLDYAHLLHKLGTPQQLISSRLEEVDAEKIGYMSVVIVRKPPKLGYEE